MRGGGRAHRRSRSSSSRWSRAAPSCSPASSRTPSSARSSPSAPGGVLAELIGEAAFRIAPLTDVDAEELVTARQGRPARRRLPRRAAGGRRGARRPRAAARAPRRGPPRGRRARPQPRARAARRLRRRRRPRARPRGPRRVERAQDLVAARSVVPRRRQLRHRRKRSGMRSPDVQDALSGRSLRDQSNASDREVGAMTGKKDSRDGVDSSPSVVLIAFGAAARSTWASSGCTTVRDSIKQEQIYVRRRRRPGRREVRRPVGRRAGHDRRPGAGVREGHADAHARGDGRPGVRADGPFPVGREAGRPGGHEDEAAAAKDESGSRSRTAPATSG